VFVVLCACSGGTPNRTDVAVPPPVCPARAHGALGDGTTLATAAIQAAVDECAGAGGTVVLDAGTYLSGTVRLASRMTLRIGAGATLLGTTDMADWTDKGLLVADACDDLTIEGPGTIDGNGPFWWASEPAFGVRPQRLVQLRDCTGVTVRDLRMRQSPRCSLRGGSRRGPDGVDHAWTPLGRIPAAPVVPWLVLHGRRTIREGARGGRGHRAHCGPRGRRRCGARAESRAPRRITGFARAALTPCAVAIDSPRFD